METIAFIPARIGSKGISKKNLTYLYGHPLLYWVLDTLYKAKNNNILDKIVVSGDSPEIENYVNSLNFGIEYWDRDPKTATDEATTESAMLDYVNYNGPWDGGEHLFLVQCTNPWLKMQDYINVRTLALEGHDVVSVTQKHLYEWQYNYNINHYKRRLPRQQKSGKLIENGAIYVTMISDFIRSGFRVSKNIKPYLMPSHTALEIDTLLDLSLAESICEYYNNQPNLI